MTFDQTLLKRGLSCTCPRCGEGKLYASAFDFNMRNTCPSCGLDFTGHDSADGPAFILICVLGTILVPLALIFDAMVTPPLWVHAVLWGILALVLTLGSLKPLKSYIMAVQFKHRPGDWS